MYQYSYSEILADSSSDARAEERRALDRAVTLLRLADGSAPQSHEEREALSYVSPLWCALIKDLASSENDLPDMLRASLMSVGLGILMEINRIEAGQSRDFASLAEICQIIRDGLV